jgi:hypothetical protein
MSGRLRRLARIWFGSVALDRPTYAVAGGALLLVHYAVQAAGIWILTRAIASPLVVYSPFLWSREALHLTTPAMVALILLTNLLLAWVGTSMSIRRAIDAGAPGWMGCGFLLPLFNWITVVVLALVPSAASPAAAEETRASTLSFATLFLCATVGAAIGLGLCAFCVYALDSYGASLFVVTPFVMGFAVGYFSNLGADRGAEATAGAVLLSLMLTFGGLIAFAMEGAVCVLMAAPIAIAVALPGGMVGRMVARRTALEVAHVGLLVLSLPLLMGAEVSDHATPLREVATSVEIDAPPSVVWPHVIGFTDLPPPSELVFRLGIAYPRRARIEGTGVGAVRRCEFSTGPFVEPITRWEEPSRLSFDVVSQPHPMHEWSPYRHVNAPHLLGTMRSKRGEFRLVALDGGRTRLEGSTWYELEMSPGPYWTLWSDALVHAIHTRVLAHIKRLAEADLRRDG